MRNEKKIGAIRASTLHDATGWGAGPNCLKRVRANARAECLSLAAETRLTPAEERARQEETR